MAEKKRLHIFLSGRVQGVGFRSFIKRNAERLSLSGWAKNLLDGRVELVFAGKKEEVKKMVELIEEGPRFADVRDLEIKKREYEGKYSDFKIRF